jgi:hypothetical protein
VVFGVLGEITVGTGIGDLLDDARALDGLEIFDLSLKRGIAFRGHRHLFHLSQSSLGSPRTEYCPGIAQSKSRIR